MLEQFLRHQIDSLFQAQRSCFAADVSQDMLFSEIQSTWVNKGSRRLFDVYRKIIEQSSYSEETLIPLLKEFGPWRKGPFQLGPVYIDSEWDCAIKWKRIESALDWTGKKVLDVGCGNGYFLYSLARAGADFALGLDPFMFYYFQFLSVQHFLKDNRVDLLPLGWQSYSFFKSSFDVLLCMGVLYHQKDPIDLLKGLRECLSEGGTLVLETLIVDESHSECLVPSGRYGNMRNVYAIPSVKLITEWLTSLSFKDIRSVDISYTKMSEQSSTEWTSDFSLRESLDPEDPSKTVEGHPAPKRVVMLASI